ncbi:MAG: response regulator [Oscillospiraceae bacterium]|nr:response regulator [Oscillospiraceae bacterium]
MENKLSIFLVEDDPFACKEIINLIDNSDDLVLIGVTNNALKAIEEIRYKLPDAVILDIELHQGSGSGLDVLKELKDLALAAPPYVLVTTNNSSALTYELARKLGADYILSKHQENYSEKYVINLLKMFASTIKNRSKHAILADISNLESPEYYEKRVTQRIISELDHVGINPKAKGYQYLIKAILIMIKEPTQNISTIVAKDFNKTEISVERAMQNAINRAWTTANIEDLEKYYTARISSEKGKPTLTEFICYYATKIKNAY